MIRRLQLLLFWCFLIFPAAIVLGDFELTQWKFLRPIQIPEITSPRTVSVVIDDTVISKTVSLDFELRVVDGQSQEVPFNLITDRDETGEEKRFDVTILNQGVFKSDYQQFMCDMKKSGLPVNQILLETSSHDFVRRADVDGSDDQRHWLSLAKGLHIFDWPEGRRVMMEIPDSNYRYLRVILWLDRGKPLTIEGVSVAHVVRQKGQQEPVRFTLLSKTLFTPDKYSEWIFDFGHQNPLVNRSELIINDPNFRRRVDVATSDDDKQWTAGPSLEIFRVTSQTGKDEFTRLETNALHHRYLRVRIMNGDNRPLDVKEIRFYRFLRQVVFVAEPGGKYSLYYGNPEAHRPSYDLTGLGRGSLADSLKGILGTQENNPDFTPPQDQRPWTERHQAVLWSILIVVVVLLGSLLVRSLRSMGGSA